MSLGYAAGHRLRTVCPMVAETKLTRPRVPLDVVEDSDRLALLDQAADKPLTLVCAPAGYGKTTLVSHWLDQRKPVHAWLALETRDNQPALFWDALRCSLARIDRHFEHRQSALINALQRRGEQEPVDHVINALADYSRTWQAPQQLYLILDDFHLITDPDLLAQCRRLIDFAPGCLRVILISRTSPPLRLAQLMARNQVLSLEADRLRFNADMTRRFLIRRVGHQLDEGQIHELHLRTGGWPAALQLATLTPEVGKLASMGSGEAMSDYLLEEIFSQLPDPLQGFLLDIAQLPYVSAELANAVRQADDGEVMIADIREHNLLMQHLGTDGKWYRLHDLLRDWLLDRPTPPARRRQLRLRAAQAFVDSGRFGEALELYLAEQCYSQAESLLPAWLEETETLPAQRDLVQRFPDALRQRSPVLAIVEAFFHFMDGRYEDVLDTLDRAEGLMAAVQQPLSATLSQLILLLRCPSTRFIGESFKAQSLASQVEATLTGTATGFRAWAFYTLGANAFMDSELELSQRFLQRGLAIAYETGDAFCAVRCLAILIPVIIHRGELHQAWATFQAASDKLADVPVSYDEDAIMAYLHGLLFLESHDLDQARAQLDQAFSLGGSRITPLDRLYFLFARFRLELFSRRSEEGVAVLTQMEQLHRELAGPWSYNMPSLEVLRALVRLPLGDASGLIQWSRQPESGEHLTRFTELHEMVLRQAGLLALGHYDPDQLASMRSCARQGDNRLILGRLQVLEAIALWYRQQQSEQALQLLADTLMAQVPKGNVRIFLDDGPLLVPLLHACVQQGRAGLSAQTILALMGGGKSDSQAREEPTKQVPEGMFDVISERERDVLELLAAGLTNRALSDRLGITLATVKSHLSNIYGKLGVANRTGAVARARELGMITR